MFASGVLKKSPGSDGPACNSLIAETLDLSLSTGHVLAPVLLKSKIVTRYGWEEGYLDQAGIR